MARAERGEGERESMKKRKVIKDDFEKHVRLAEKNIGTGNRCYSEDTIRGMYLRLVLEKETVGFLLSKVWKNKNCRKFMSKIGYKRGDKFYLCSK